VSPSPPPLRNILIVAPGTRWDGHVTRTLATGEIQRDLGDGVVGVLAPQGREVEVEQTVETRGGESKRRVRCHVYALVGRRRVSERAAVA
jgi:hypothetical protein